VVAHGASILSPRMVPRSPAAAQAPTAPGPGLVYRTSDA
jgi:hypothetical protein